MHLKALKRRSALLIDWFKYIVQSARGIRLCLPGQPACRPIEEGRIEETGRALASQSIIEHATVHTRFSLDWQQ